MMTLVAKEGDFARNLLDVSTLFFNQINKLQDWQSEMGGGGKCSQI